jgi:hypothetical protein
VPYMAPSSWAVSMTTAVVESEPLAFSYRRCYAASTTLD